MQSVRCLDIKEQSCIINCQNMCKFRDLETKICQKLVSLMLISLRELRESLRNKFREKMPAQIEGDLRPTKIRGKFPNIAEMSCLQTKSCQTINQCRNRCSRCHTHKQTIAQLHGHVQQLQQPPAGGSCLPRVFWRIFASISSSCFSCWISNQGASSYSCSAAFRLRFSPASLLATDAHFLVDL